MGVFLAGQHGTRAVDALRVDVPQSWQAAEEGDEREERDGQGEEDEGARERHGRLLRHVHGVLEVLVVVVWVYERTPQWPREHAFPDASTS